ncbi:hypothetical protein K9L67_03460 [Candidatus Woesearchaeota archaeon]|nr:hypothetical protein [Candidatus Woesearchaeota archaeon]MCF7901260.1 hypothetical protein [Candidatus Woesearchaeota archaeon]MCF8013573.1 hypothetical protein [Candidatus Woesearchaeota archaeon]
MSKLNKKYLALFCAIISGIFLIFSGTSGYSAMLFFENLVLQFVNFSVLKVIFFILSLIAVLGGLSVITGGLIKFYKYKKTGNFLIWIGSGFGILNLLFSVFVVYFSGSNFFIWFFSYATLGLILSFVARKL